MRLSAHRPCEVSAVNAALLALLIATAPSAGAAEPMGSTLCAVLKELVPQVRTFKPEGARAQLVMAIAEKYDADARQLRQVRAQIDTLTAAACPRDREAMLGILRMKSLADAVS